MRRQQYRLAACFTRWQTHVHWSLESFCGRTNRALHCWRLWTTTTNLGNWHLPHFLQHQHFLPENYGWYNNFVMKLWQYKICMLIWHNMTYFNICREKQSQNSTWLSAKLVCWCNFQDWFSALGELRIGGQDTQKALNQQKASIDRLNLFDEDAFLRDGSLQKKLLLPVL